MNINIVNENMNITMDTNESIDSQMDKQSWTENKTNSLECNLDPKESEQIVSDYWNISNSKFKQCVSMIVNDDPNRQLKIKRWLDTDNILLQFIRQRACLIAQVYSLKMEQDFWQVYKSVTRIEARWLSKMSKSMIKWNNIDETFFETEKNMNQQLKTLEKQLKKAIEKLNEHLQERPQALKLSTIDMSLLCAVTIAFARQDQQQLRIKYEQKNIPLMLIINDVRFVKEFYDLEPDGIQTSMARTIWQATIDEQQARNEINVAKDSTFDDDQSNFNSAIEFERNFSVQQISLAKAKAEDNAQIIENEKKRFLSDMQHKQHPLAGGLHLNFNADTMLHIIESRQRTLKKRVKLIDEIPKTFIHSNHAGDRNDTDDDDDENYVDID